MSEQTPVTHKIYRWHDTTPEGYQNFMSVVIINSTANYATN